MDEVSLDELLALPDDALLDVMMEMQPSKLYAITSLSPRCKNLASQKIRFNVTKLEAKGTTILVDYAPGRSETFTVESENEIMEEEEWKEFLTEFSKLLGHSFTSLVMETQDLEDTWKWIENCQNGLKKLELTVKKQEDSKKNVDFILKNSKLDHLQFDLQLQGTFKYSDPFVFENPPKVLIIENSSWITVQNVIDVGVRECTLRESTFTDEDLNFLLKYWKSTKKLGHLTIERESDEDIDVKVLFDGLEYTAQDSLPRCYGRVYFMAGDNGTSAAVYVNETFFGFKPA